MRKLLSVAAFAIVLSACSKKDDGFSGNPGTYNHNGNVGASAKDILSSSSYTSLTVEILYMPGFALNSGTISQLTSFLNARLNKPDGITITSREIPAASGSTLDIGQVREIENANRKAFASNKNLGLTILVTNGNYSESGVLGVAYRNTSAALFGKIIQDNSGGLGQTSRQKLEATVLEHEIAHLLGLVNIGSPMVANHQDAAHGNHCSNKDCLMYYATDDRNTWFTRGRKRTCA